MVTMVSPCVEGNLSQCINGCCRVPFLSSTYQPSSVDRCTTTRASRRSFLARTKSSLFPETNFTNHESLPGFPDAFTSFLSAYPSYVGTEQADRIREEEYQHLASHTCLDYTGFSLFSHAQMNSSCSGSPSKLQPPLLDISYRTTSLTSLLRGGKEEMVLESAMRRRMMSFLNVFEEDYSMVCTANRTSAFKLLADCYPFHSNPRLVTVYDYESEAATSMAAAAEKRGARVSSASFTWPSLRIDTTKLKKMVGRRKKSKRGLFVFPLQSRMTGARYSYQWMTLAQDNGWHVVLDASALAPKDMDTLGLSLIQPDFIICSFFKVFGENPSGFAVLFVKNSSRLVLENSMVAKTIGIVGILPAKLALQDSHEFSSGTHLEEDEEDEDDDIANSFSSLLPPRLSNGVSQSETFEKAKPTDTHSSSTSKQDQEAVCEIVEVHNSDSFQETSSASANEIECRGLDHADTLGHPLITSRLRYLTNWLVSALARLEHPNSERGNRLVSIYGPMVKFDRGPTISFNVFDWKGEKVDPALLQKLADRSNISLTCGFLQNICFPDKYEEEKEMVLEKRITETRIAGNRRKERIDLGISVVNASLGFLTNFEDVYNLWAFIAKFLDADFVEKERWRYVSLNQKVIVV